MSHFATETKIGKIVESELLLQVERLQALLLSGDLGLFEKELSETLTRVHDQVSELLTSESAQKLKTPLKKAEQAKGGRNISTRWLKIRLFRDHGSLVGQEGRVFFRGIANGRDG